MTGFWAVLVPAEAYADERLYDRETVRLAASGPVPGDRVLLLAPGEPPALYAVGRVINADRGLDVAYHQKSVDAARPAGDLGDLDGGPVPLTEERFWAVAARLGPAADRRSWLVSVDLPIEAESPAEAVRRFWSYVTELGPSELPAFVTPVGDELAMQAFVLGAQTSLDPEDED